MIILDTNVMAQLMRNPPDEEVIAWANNQPARDLWLNAVSVYETRFGLARMPEGARRQKLEAEFEALLRDDFAGRILNLDRAAAEAAGRLAATCMRQGRPMEVRDAMIGGIALAHRAVLATRNLRHFRIGGITVLDPWSV